MFVLNFLLKITVTPSLLSTSKKWSEQVGFLMRNHYASLWNVSNEE